MGLMDDIEKLAQKGRDLAEDHPDQVRKALDQAEDVLDKRTGGKHASQIDSVGDKVADFLTPDPPKDASTAS
jgi:MT0933-like antitoxin protein